MQTANLPYNLGRVHEPDDRDFKMSALLPGTWPKVRRRHWTLGPILDQGHTNSCVGYAWKQFLQTTPLRTMGGSTGFDIYIKAKLLDDDPYNDYTDTGTSVRAGAQTLIQEGRLKSYVFAQNIDDIVRWILTKGPVVLGTVWTRRMFFPDSSGYIWPDNNVVGGHAYIMWGVDRDTNEANCASSWGTMFGLQGRFKLRLDVLDQLLMNNGEACTAIEKKLVNA